MFLFDFTYERKEGQVGVAIENKQDIKELKLIVLFLFGFCIFYLTGEKSLHYLKPTKIKELEPIALFSFNILLTSRGGGQIINCNNYDYGTKNVLKGFL